MWVIKYKRLQCVVGIWDKSISKIYGSCPQGIYNEKFTVYEDLNRSTEMLEMLGSQLTKMRAYPGQLGEKKR